MRLILKPITKITIRKYKMSEYLFALIFIVPYMEVGIMNDLSFKQNGLYLPFIIIVLSFFIFIFAMVNFLFRKKDKESTTIFRRLQVILLLKVLLDTHLLIRGLMSGNVIKSLIQLSYIVIPFYFSILAVMIITKKKLNVMSIIKIGISYFIAYSIIAYFYNIFVYKIELFSSVSSRFVTPGGGPVIFGYTIVIITSLIFLNQKGKNTVTDYLQFITLFLVSLATGSRGSMWPMTIMSILFILNNKKIDKKIMIILIATIMIIIINPLNYLINYIPRFGMGVLTDSSRLDTVINSLSAFSKESIDNLFLGFGVGNFFPYQEWQILFDQYTSNYFYYNDYKFLVQPHNSYIYILIEGGILGLFLFMSIFVYCIKVTLRKNLSVFKSGIVPILILCMLFFLDSLLIIHPGPTSQLWFIILLLITLKESNYESSYVDI